MDLTPPRAGSGGRSLGVLVCTHDAARLDQVSSAVASLGRQTRVPDEVLVMVDGTDELTDQVREALSSHTSPDGSAVRVEGLGRNRGVSVARTAGARRMESDVVAFLDDDAEADPGWLAALERPLEEQGVIGSSGRSEPVWVGARPAWMPEEFLWTVGCSYRGMPTEPTRIRNVYGGCAALRRDVFLDVGGYDPDMGHGAGRSGGAEEAEFCLRATASTGGSFAFEPGAVIRHRVPGDRLTWRYYLRRCHSEGELKAVMARQAAPGALGPESAFARALPRAVVRGLVTPGRRQSAVGIVLGALAVLAGMVSGSLKDRLRRRGAPVVGGSGA